MTTLGCSIANTVKTPLNETVIELNEELVERKFTLDESLLRKCLWVEKYMEGGLLSVSQVHKINALRFRECYILHNSLIDSIKLITDNNK